MFLGGEQEDAARVGLEAAEFAFAVDQLLRLDVVNQVVAAKAWCVEVRCSEEFLTILFRRAQIDSSAMLHSKLWRAFGPNRPIGVGRFCTVIEGDRAESIEANTRLDGGCGAVRDRRRGDASHFRFRRRGVILNRLRRCRGDGWNRDRSSGQVWVGDNPLVLGHNGLGHRRSVRCRLLGGDRWLLESHVRLLRLSDHRCIGGSVQHGVAASGCHGGRRGGAAIHCDLGRRSIREALFVSLRSCDFSGFPIAMPEGNTVDHLTVHIRILRTDRSVDFFAVREQVDVGRPSSDLIAITQLLLFLAVDANRDELTVDLSNQLGVAESLLFKQSAWRTVISVEVQHQREIVARRVSNCSGEVVDPLDLLRVGLCEGGCQCRDGDSQACQAGGEMNRNRSEHARSSRKGRV